VYDLLIALKPLKSRPNQQLNMTRFGACYNLSSEQTKTLIDLVLQFQSFFFDGSERFFIQSRWKNGALYLSLVSENEFKKQSNDKEIYLSSRHANTLLDLTYVYQCVKIGKGFDSNLVKSDLCQKAKKLYAHHPYLITQKGNGILYPTSLGIQLGEQLRIYSKLNRKVTIIDIDDYVIHVGDEKTNG